MITHHHLPPVVGRKLGMSTFFNRGVDIDSAELSILCCLIHLGLVAKSMIMILLYIIISIYTLSKDIQYDIK